MIDFVANYGLFLAKAATVVLAVLVMTAGVIALSSRGHLKHRAKDGIEVKSLNKVYERMADTLDAAMLSKKALKRKLKARKKRHKAERSADADRRRRVFVLNFKGDIRASAVASLREEITGLLTVAEPEDEVVVRLDSPGGVVHGYGLAASQLLRVKDRKLRLTVAVDKVAASGGYMMACVADRIIAAPFAVVGSIGVVAQLPNFNRLLQKNDVDFEQFTAGEYKRTITLFGPNTDEGREKFREEIEDTHLLFKDFVKQHRAVVDIPTVATGEHWFGTRALDLKLVDELRTSDDYLLEASRSADLYQITYSGHRTLVSRFLGFTEKALARQIGL